jgi:hypothetical protein
LLRHVFYSPRMTVPDNIVKQIAEGRPVVLALLCSCLRAYYLPTADDLPPDTLQFSGIAAPYAAGVRPALIDGEKPDLGAALISVLVSASRVPLSSGSRQWPISGSGSPS